MSRNESDDLVIEHRLTVEEDLYFERRALRVNGYRGEDIYSLRIIRRIEEDEFFFEITNEDTSSGVVRVITFLDDRRRANFYGRWNNNWTPHLPMSPIIPQGVDHVINVDPFALCPLRSLNERSGDYIAHSWGGNSRSMGQWQHVWEFQIKRRMPTRMEESMRSFTSYNAQSFTRATMPVKEMTIVGPYEMTERGGSSKELRRVICEEIIPPMTKGLGALERILCRHERSMMHDRTMTLEERQSLKEITRDAIESYKTEGKWLDEPLAEKSWLTEPSAKIAQKTFTGMTLSDPSSPVELLAKIRIFGTCEIGQTKKE